MIKQKFNDHAEKLLQIIQRKLPHATYISVLLFKGGALIKSLNNNFNNWADNYTEHDMAQDNVFFEISHKKLKDSNNTICFWNSVPHESAQSHKIHKRRAEYGLYNGVTILESIDDKYTLGINLTSDDKIEEDDFYSKVILNRKFFMKELKKLLSI